MNSRPGALPPSPPHSVARSSNGTGLYSVNSSSGGRKYSMAMMEEQLVQHHRVLKDYLAASEREDRGYIPHNRARDKLLRLSPIQFQELSTDVYDELLRREDERNLGGPDAPGNNVPKYLLPKQNFHPKRNQARQKLSTLAIRKFRELATDVLYELERRLPQINGSSASGMSSPTDSNGGRFRPNMSVGVPPYGGGLRRPSDTSLPYSPGIFENNQRNGPGSSSSAENGGRPLPKQFQSNTMIPNKGIMVEDDDDGTIDDEHDGDAFDLERDVNRSSKRTTNKSLPYSLRENQFAAEYQPQISALESRIDELEAQLKQKEEQVERVQSAEKTAIETLEQERLRSSDLTTDLERQLRSVEDLNHSLEEELQKARANNAELLTQHQGSGTGNDEWHERYLDLEKEFHDQQQTTDEVRQEAMQSLQEMRLMSEKSNRAAENEEKLQQQVTQLEASLNEWKARYAKTRTQLRSLKASSMAGHIDQPNANQLIKGRAFTDPNGLIKDVTVTKFQMSIDELLHLAHREDPSAVLDYMRSIVATVRIITSEVDPAGAESLVQESANDQRREKLKAKVSAATNNLITAAKAFSAGDGLSPVALVDAAAANLSASVIELIKLVKIKYSPSEDLADDDASELQPVAYSRAPSRNKTFQ